MSQIVQIYDRARSPRTNSNQKQVNYSTNMADSSRLRWSVTHGNIGKLARFLLYFTVQELNKSIINSWPFYPISEDPQNLAVLTCISFNRRFIVAIFGDEFLERTRESPVQMAIVAKMQQSIWVYWQMKCLHELAPLEKGLLVWKFEARPTCSIEREESTTLSMGYCSHYRNLLWKRQDC